MNPSSRLVSGVATLVTVVDAAISERSSPCWIETCMLIPKVSRKARVGDVEIAWKP